MKTAQILLIAALCASSSAMPGRVAAAAEPQKPEEARAIVRSVVLQQARPDTRVEYRWVKREQKRNPQQESPWLEALFKQLEEAFGSLAGLRQYAALLAKSGVLLALAGFLIVYLIYAKRFAWLTALWSAGSAPAKQPDMLFGLDVRPESLLNAPDQASMELFAAGRQRESLSLLYRAALSRLIHDYQVQLHPSLTELECEKRVARQGKTVQSSYFRHLTFCWIRSAYGHEVLDQALHHSLTQGWKEAFG